MNSRPESTKATGRKLEMLKTSVTIDSLAPPLGAGQRLDVAGLPDAAVAERRMTVSQTAALRQDLLGSLRLDIIGPETAGPYEKEALPQAPSRWYLTGFLVPYEAPADQRE